MAEFEVKVRNLKTGETMIASMADSDQCIAWLSERPPFIEILTVLSDVSPAEQHRLKEAMRPYDDEEQKLKQEYDEKLAAALQEKYAEELALIESEGKGDGPANTDPNRPLAVKYDMDDGLIVVDDDRAITDAAKEACLAWVAERNEWVKDKGQVVGEAHLEVWPADMPEGDDRRVLEGGRFFPRLA
ncbi:MAG: hypothetical protein AB8I08_01460 [Sandaracinaceae bacterium]